MALPAPREGTSLGFKVHPETSYEGILGSPEKILWSSIRHMCVHDVADSILYNVYNVTSKNLRTKITKNIKVYLNHAFEFYEAALTSKANTASLFYYYSFLNLAKALCEISHPSFHRRPESYNHCISWKPSSKYIVNMKTVSINITTRRGVWHVLEETIQNQPFNIPNSLKLKINPLFSFCPEIRAEFEKTYN